MSNVHLKNRNQCPLNGFQFVQPETQWSRKAWNFEGLCQELLAHRKANPKYRLPTDIETIREEVDTANAMRCLQAGAPHFVVSDDGVPKYRAPLPRKPVVGGAETIATGATLLKDLLGGDPVDSELATRRAAVCVDCPMNGKGDWTRFFTIPASASIRTMLEARHGMKLTTVHDGQLGICTPCKCPLPLKVHTAISVVRKHTDPEVEKQLPAHCWVKTEA